MDSAGAGILAQGNAHLIYQFRVPRSSRSNTAGKECTARIVSYALGAVGQTDFGNAQPLDGSYMEAIPETCNEGDFFLKGHLCRQGRGAFTMGRSNLLGKDRKHRCCEQCEKNPFFHRIPYFFRILRTGLRTLRAQRV